MADLVPVPTENIGAAWELVRPLILKGLKRTQGRMTETALFQKVAQNEWQLWIVWEDDDKQAKGVVITEIFKETAGHKVATIRFLSGIELEEWAWLIDVVELWALQEGCDYVSIWVDKGIARMAAKELDEYRVTHWMFEKRLKPAKPERPEDGVRHQRRNPDHHTPAI